MPEKPLDEADIDHFFDQERTGAWGLELRGDDSRPYEEIGLARWLRDSARLLGRKEAALEHRAPQRSIECRQGYRRHFIAFTDLALLPMESKKLSPNQKRKPRHHSASGSISGFLNAFGAGLKLALSGYQQNSALILRDVLETVSLLSLFAGDRALIGRWRLADKNARMKEFSPVRVRDALDACDGFTSKRRAEMYELFSELAGHPTMKSSWMMRPQKDGDAVIGSFMEAMALKAVREQGQEWQQRFLRPLQVW